MAAKKSPEDVNTVPADSAPLLLAVDVGNSHTTCGIFRRDSLIDHFRLRSEPRQASDELAAACHMHLALRGLDLATLGEFALSSVVPALERQWRDMADNYCPGLRHAPLVIDHHLDCGLVLCIEEPERLGADRLVNAAMAWQRCRAACIAVDVGTALTCDCVNARGEFVGGVILPGPALALDALIAGTARLPSIDLSMPLTAVTGKNTQEAIRSGMLIGWGGMVDRLLDRLTAELVGPEDTAQVLITGGMGRLLAPYCDRPVTVDPHLTLHGLAWLYQRHCRR